MTQKQVYSVLALHNGFELRSYEDCVLVQVVQRGDFITAGSRGFSPLFSFISGNNSKRQKIAMTAPVIQQPLSSDEHVISFVMPADFKLEDTPAPFGSTMKVTAVPAHLAAARSFRGSWNSARFESEGAELLAAVANAGLKISGNLYWSRFDPPFKPGFLRHNEVLVDLEK